MAGEFAHGSVGTELTQAEWEAVGAHVLDSQATGDIVYASSASQLTRLAKGTDTHVLTLASGVPSWAAPAAAAAGSLTGATLASGVTASSLTSVGTIATGVWQGTDVGVAYGGTGVSTLTSNAVLTGNGASAITAEANLTFDGSTLTLGGDLQVVNGSAGSPSITFTDDPDTGLYSPAANQFGITAGGVVRVFYGAGGEFNFGGSTRIEGPQGSSGLPGFGFSGDANTGMYRAGADGLGFSAGGTLSLYMHAGALSLYNAGMDLDINAGYIQLSEMAAPGAGAADHVRVYALEDGGGLTDLAAVFQDGTVDVFAQEVTPLDAPIFRYPSRTEGRLVLRKPHPGLQVIEMVFPDDTNFILHEIEHHDTDKIRASVGSEGPLPADWFQETEAERGRRQLEEERRRRQLEEELEEIEE